MSLTDSAIGLDVSFNFLQGKAWDDIFPVRFLDLATLAVIEYQNVDYGCCSLSLDRDMLL